MATSGNTLLIELINAEDRKILEDLAIRLTGIDAEKYRATLARILASGPGCTLERPMSAASCSDSATSV